MIRRFGIQDIPRPTLIVARSLFRLVAGIVFSFAGAAVVSASTDVDAAETEAARRAAVRPDMAYFTKGRFLYQEHCMVCHGTRGRGDGELVREDWPDKPRNFTAGVFQYQSTPAGKLPTNEDLTRTIRTGVANTNMPSFAHLPDDDIRALVEYVKFFSRKWRDPDNYGEPMTIPQAPAWFENPDELAQRREMGRQLFVNTCAPCHGENGDGQGPAAASLVNAAGEPIRPADLRGALKTGRALEDTWRTIAVGINGTPMVGFAAALGEEEIWNLVAYIRGLRASWDQVERITSSGKVTPSPAFPLMTRTEVLALLQYQAPASGLPPAR